jgi:hypothetical protein
MLSDNMIRSKVIAYNIYYVNLSSPYSLICCAAIIFAISVIISGGRLAECTVLPRY